MKRTSRSGCHLLRLVVVLVGCVGANAVSARATDAKSVTNTRAVASPVAAAGAWLMPSHDPQRTARSSVTGPTKLRLVWGRDDTTIYALGTNGNLYGQLVSPTASGPVALGPAGTVRWVYPAPAAAVCVAATGGILAMGVAPDETPFALGLSSDGAVQWRLQPFGLTKGSPPFVRPSGHFFVAIVGPENGTPGERYIGLNDISPSGTVRTTVGSPPTLVARSHSGELYMLGEVGLAALTARYKARWRRTMGPHQFGAQSLALAGTRRIYVDDGYGHLLALSDSGKVLWRVRRDDAPLALSIRGDGTVVAAGKSRVEAYDASGKRLWQYALPDAGSFFAPSVATDAAGTTYIAWGTDVAALGPDGELLDLTRVPAAINPATLIVAPGGRLVVSGPRYVRVFSDSGA